MRTFDNINIYSSEDFLAIIFKHKSMSQNNRQNQRWKKLGYDNQKLPERSAYSRDSSMHSKYTPTKKQILSPNQKLNLATLQSRVTSVKQFSNQQSKKQENSGNQSNIAPTPTAYFNLVNRTNSIETQNPTTVNLTKSPNTRYNYKNQNRERRDQILNQYYDKQQIKPSFRNSHKPKRSSEQGSLIKPYQLAKINGLLGKKASFQSQYDDQPFPAQNQKKKTVENLLQNYLNELSLIEKDMGTQRLFIQNQLEQKQRHFLKVKEQVLRLFAKHEKKIQDPNLRQAIEDYIPKQLQKNNPLMRVTSQKIFNRLPTFNTEMRSSAMGAINDNNIQSNTQRTLKLADFRSVKSRQSSAYKQNFNTIFQTLNQMKKGLDDTDPTTSKQINTTKQLIVPASPVQKTLKKSLLLLKNEKKDKDKDKNSNQKQQMDKVNKQIMFKITELLKTPSLTKIS